MCVSVFVCVSMSMCLCVNVPCVNVPVSLTIICHVNGGFCVDSLLDCMLHRFIYCFIQG